MKLTIRFFLMGFLCISLFSCDDDDQEKLSALLIGNWTATTQSMTECEEEFRNNRVYTFGNCPDQVCQEFTFYNNGNVDYRYKTANIAYTDVSGTYEFTGKQIIVCIEFFGDCLRFEIEVYESELITLVKNDDTGCLTVTNFIKHP